MKFKNFLWLQEVCGEPPLQFLCVDHWQLAKFSNQFQQPAKSRESTTPWSRYETPKQWVSKTVPD
jgi:hypothetical protein